MPIVRKLPNGTYFMVYEVCTPGGQFRCAIYYRTSTDGWAWGAAADFGTRPTTADGRYFTHAPNIAYGGNKLFLVGQVLNNANGSLAAGNGQTVFVNTQNGTGAWSTITAPVAVPGAFDNFCPNYSSALLASVDGASLLELASDYDGNVCKPYYAIGAAGGASPTATPTAVSTANPTPTVGALTPIASYALEGNALDGSGNGRNGTVNGGVTFVAGHLGQAANFNGMNAFIQIPRSIQGSFSMSFWIRTTATGGSGAQWWNGRGLVDGEVANVVNDFGTSLLGSRIAFGVGNPDTTIQSTSNINNGAWHHVAVTRNSGSGAMVLYVDGVQQASVTGPIGTKSAPPNLRLGSLQTNLNFFAGQLDEVRLYNDVLTAAQVAALP